jgi:hypothetical protein
MSETAPPSRDPAGDDHDHAWSHVKGDLAYAPWCEYRCDVCGLAWSL